MTLEEYTNKSIEIMMKDTENNITEDSIGVEENNISVIKMSVDDFYKANYTPEEFIQELRDTSEV